MLHLKCMQVINLVTVCLSFNGFAMQIKPSIDQRLDFNDSSQHYTHHWIKEQELYSNFIPRMMIKFSWLSMSLQNVVLKVVYWWIIPTPKRPKSTICVCLQVFNPVSRTKCPRLWVKMERCIPMKLDLFSTRNVDRYPKREKEAAMQWKAKSGSTTKRRLPVIEAIKWLRTTPNSLAGRERLDFNASSANRSSLYPKNKLLLLPHHTTILTFLCKITQTIDKNSHFNGNGEAF